MRAGQGPITRQEEIYVCGLSAHFPYQGVILFIFYFAYENVQPFYLIYSRNPGQILNLQIPRSTQVLLKEALPSYTDIDKYRNSNNVLCHYHPNSHLRAHEGGVRSKLKYALQMGFFFLNCFGEVECGLALVVSLPTVVFTFHS